MSPTDGDIILNVFVRTASGTHVITDAAMFVEFVDMTGVSSGVLLLFPENTLVSEDTVYEGSVSLGTDPEIDFENLAKLFITLSNGRTKLLGGNTIISFASSDLTYIDDREEGAKLIINSETPDRERLKLNLAMVGLSRRYHEGKYFFG